MKRVILTAVFALLASNLFAADALTANKRESWLNSFLSGGGMGAEPFAADPVSCSSNWTRREYYNTATNTKYVCDGTAWRAVTLIGSTGTAGLITAADLATSSVATAEILDDTVASGDIADGTIVNVDINASAAIARSKLAEDALALTDIPIANMRLSTFAVMGVSAADDNEFHLAVATNAVTLNSDSADNTTDTSTFRFMLRLPQNYVSAGDVSIRFRVALIESGAAATDNGSSIDLSCYEQGDGAVGADIVSTAAQTFAATDTWYSKDFSLTATDLVAGDILSCLATGAVIENNAGAETITMKTNVPVLLVDVKG